MDAEKRIAGNYEITQSMLIGDKEVVFGVDDNNPEHPYFCAFYESNAIIGQYTDCMVGNDYAELVMLYAKRIEQQCEKLKEAENAVTVPRETITADMCTPLNYKESIHDRVVVIRSDVLRPEYQTADNQLVYVIGGFGAEGSSRGDAVFIINLYSGKESRINRSDILGEMNNLPDWAVERQNAIRTERMKEMKTQEFQSR